MHSTDSDSLPGPPPDEEEEEGEEEEEEKEGRSDKIGGLFHVARRETVSAVHLEDSSVLNLELERDWSECASVVKTLFVTGSWGEEDAATLLERDGEEEEEEEEEMEESEEEDGELKDLETREKHGRKQEDEQEMGREEEERLKKKKQLKVSDLMKH